MSSSERVLRETALPSRGDVSPGTGTAESPNRESATSRALGLSGNGSGRGDVEGAASTPDGLAGSLAIRAGELVKRSVVGSLVKNWKRRYFVLREDRLDYYRSAGDAHAGKLLKTFSFSASSEVFTYVDTSAVEFAVTGDRGTLMLKASSEEERDSWVSDLRKIVSRHTSATASDSVWQACLTSDVAALRSALVRCLIPLHHLRVVDTVTPQARGSPTAVNTELAIVPTTGPIRAPAEASVPALCVASAVGFMEGVRLLCSAGSPVDCRDSRGRTPLMYAAREGHADVITELITGGAEPDVRRQPPRSPAGETAGPTALAFAAQNGHTTCCIALISSGADPDVRCLARGQTPLVMAAAAGHADVVELLLTAGADPDARIRGSTLSDYVASPGTGRVAESFTALSVAAERGFAAVVEELLSGGADVEGCCGSASARGDSSVLVTPLALAAREGHVDVVRELLEAGAACDALLLDGSTALSVARAAGQTTCVDLLQAAAAARLRGAREVGGASCTSAVGVAQTEADGMCSPQEPPAPPAVHATQTATGRGSRSVAAALATSAAVRTLDSHSAARRRLPVATHGTE